ncbi:MAG: ABC transporter permease [Actinomycetota bacterium]
MERWNAWPSWARWMSITAVGVFILATVQLVGSDTEQLTSVTTAQAMLRWCVPILLAGLGGLFAERAGVVNIGLEGMMILGTWFGAYGAFNFGPWWGIAFGLFGGALGGLIHAIATVSFGVDHIVSGVAINILFGPGGATRYLSDQIFSTYEGGAITQSPRVDRVGSFTMPFLAGGNIGSWESPDLLGWLDDQGWFYISDIAGLTKGLMAQISLFTLLALALVPISGWVLWRTRFGLRLRIAGEDPVAGETLGVNIYRHKYAGVIISGALAGLAGAFIVIELTGIYREGQTNGRGFIGLAALIFGNYRPGGILAGSLLFAYPDGISLRDLDGSATHALLAVIAVVLTGVFIFSLVRQKRTDAAIALAFALGAAIWYGVTDEAPTWLPNIMPFVFVLLVLVFNSQRLRMPKASGMVYRKGET